MDAWLKGEIHKHLFQTERGGKTDMLLPKREEIIGKGFGNEQNQFVCLLELMVQHKALL